MNTVCATQVSIVVRLKANALRLNILARWGRFVVFATVVVAQSYMLRDAAAAKLRDRTSGSVAFTPSKSL